MLLNPRGHRKDIGVEDDVLWRKTSNLSQQFVASSADFIFSRESICLAFLVEGHHNDGSPKFHANTGLLKEFFLTSLETYRVNDAFALQTFKPGFDNGPLGRVDHDWDP